MTGLFDQPDEPEPLEKQAAQIYEHYPVGCKTGRGKAIKAIKSALKRLKGDVNDPFKHLVDTTKEFAEAVSKWPKDERQFCWYPATFYNGEHYDDDRARWDRSDRGTKATPAERRADKAGGEYAEGAGNTPTF